MKKLLFYLLLSITTLCQAQLLKGYNNPWFFGNFPKTGFFPTSNVITHMRALQMDVLRFPGGAIANGYDVNKPGYGFPKETGPNYIYNHTRLADSLGVKTIFVANLFMPLTVADSEAYWIQNLVDAVKICNPAVVELGNEICAYDHITGVKGGEPGLFVNKEKFKATVTASAQRYVKLCIKMMAAVRAAGYNPQFAVVMDVPFHTRGKAWNAVLRSWGGFSLEIFHPYLTTRDLATTTDAINKLIAGSIRPVLFSEWGWSHGYSQTNVLNQNDIGKDYYNAFPLNFVTACSKDPRIKIICRHQLYGSNVYSVIPSTIIF